MRVLVVEDDEDMAFLLEEVLESEGHAARWCEGSAALKCALDFRPDVVLLDYLMPDITAEKVIEQFSSHETTSSSKILLITAITDAKEVAASLGVPLVAKPFDIHALLAAVSAAQQGEVESDREAGAPPPTHRAL